jgi:IS5 family transposase
MPKDHAYRHFKKLVDFVKVLKIAKKIEKELEAIGFGKDRLLLCLLLQFLEDLSDRELERFLRENVTAKWFADFGLTEKTPDYSTFCKFRKALGTKRTGQIFDEINCQLRAKGMLKDVFTFVDATALTSKLNVWEERDKAIQAGYEKFNNEVAEKENFAADKDARFGAKSSNKFWFGFKETNSVDMQSGLINKVAVTHANVTDAEAGKRVLPKSGMVFADKGYVAIVALITALGLDPMVILKNNMKGKDADLDKFISRLRMPFERTFSKKNKRVRYRGLAKNQGAAFMQAIAYNLKRAVVLRKEYPEKFPA